MSPLGKIAIVTGGGSGIGEALSQELARRGATVVVADINSGDASRVAAAIGRSGGRAEARQVDVSSEDAVRHVVEETAASYGRLDYLFNNAYNTSKHAVVGLSLSLRIEAADLGVKVSVVCPGFVRTRIYQTAVMVNISQEKASSSSRLPSRMMAAPRAAQIILDGVDRNQAMIVFPASIRCVWRAYRIAPGLTSRLLSPLLLRRIRELRSYRLPPGQANRAAGGEGVG